MTFFLFQHKIIEKPKIQFLQNEGVSESIFFPFYRFYRVSRQSRTRLQH